MNKTPVKVLQPSKEDELKLAQFNKSSTVVDDEWMLLAEFGKAYGWEAYQAAKNDEVSLQEMMILIEANRRLEYKDQYRMSQAAFAGAGSAQSKKPSSTFRALTKNLLKKSKAD